MADALQIAPSELVRLPVPAPANGETDSAIQAVFEHIASSAGRGKRHNLRVQSWLANIEACAGHDEPARATIVRLTEAELHNGYLKYRLTHVLAELGDAEAAIRMLREAIQDGFLSVQLLQHEERLGLSYLTDLAEYRQIKLVLRQNVDQAKNRYVHLS